MKLLRSAAAVALLVAAAPLLVAAPSAAGPAPAPQAELSTRDWIAKQTDNICGLRETSQLSNPAKVDFEACVDATPEMRKVRDQGIDPSSPEGIQLRAAAVNRVTRACESVRSSNGHCSVWKEIRHRDGRSIPDLSDQVKAQF